MGRTLVSLLLVVCFMVVDGPWSSAHAKKKSKPYFKLLEAYTQRTLPGIPGARVTTNYYIIIVWMSAQTPETFLWRGDNGLINCTIAKASMAVNKGRNVTRDIDHMASPVRVSDIQRGDTLELRPLPGGKFPVPADIPASAQNTLYYKTGASGWLAFPIEKIGKKRDIAMP